jgi:hypothetical protein
MNAILHWIISRIVAFLLSKQGITNPDTIKDVQRAAVDLIQNPKQETAKTKLAAVATNSQSTPNHFDGTETHIK